MQQTYGNAYVQRALAISDSPGAIQVLPVPPRSRAPEVPALTLMRPPAMTPAVPRPEIASGPAVEQVITMASAPTAPAVAELAPTAPGATAETAPSPGDGAEPAAASAAPARGTEAAAPAAEGAAQGKEAAPAAKGAPGARAAGAPPAAGAPGPAPGEAAVPEGDERFKGVMERLEKAASRERAHEPVKKKVAQVHAAALPPPNDRMTRAEGAHVGTVAKVAEQSEAKAPPPDDFLTLLRAEIARLAPPANMEQMEEFKESGKAGQLRERIGSQVSQKKAAATGDLKTTAGAKPTGEDLPEKPVTRLPEPQPDGRPADLKAQDVLPLPKPEAEVTAAVEENKQTAEQLMADNDLDEKQLKEANEPQFSDALEAKKEFDESAAKVPGEYRAEETALLKGATEEIKTDEKEAKQDMRAKRRRSKKKVLTRQEAAQKKDEEDRQKVADDIQKMYGETQTKVMGKLEALDRDVNKEFDTGEKAARERFENDVDQKMAAYKEDRYGCFGCGVLWLKDKIFDLPDEVNRFYEEGRDQYIKDMDVVLVKIANLVESRLKEVKGDIAEGREKIDDYVKSLPRKLSKVGKDAAKEISEKFDELQEEVESKKKELAQGLARRYQEARNKLEERIKELQEANKGALTKFVDKVKEVIKILREAKDRLLALLGEAAQYVGQIIRHPIRFLGNLIKAVKGGFDQFVKRIDVHLRKGILAWVFGQVAAAGIEIPTEFSVKAVFGLVLQVLGLTKENIRAKVEKIVGSRNVAIIEKVWEHVSVLIAEGPAGLWEKISGEIGDIKSKVIESLMPWVTKKIIEEAVIWILSLFNPVSALIKAIKAIFSLVMFLINNINKILDVVEAVVKSIGKIVAGDIAAAANRVEDALSRTIPLVIGFLASLLGLGGVGEKVRDIIMKLRRPVDKAIDKTLGAIVRGVMKVAGKALGGLVKGGRFVVAKGKAAVEVIVMWWKRRFRFKARDGDTHSLYFVGKGSSAELMVASAEQRVRDFLTKKRAQADPSDYATFDRAIKKYKKITELKTELANLQAKPKKSEADKDKIQTKDRQLYALFVELGGDLAKLKIKDVIDELVQTHVDFSATEESRTVTASPLTEIPGNTKGARPTIKATVPVGWKHALLLNDLGQTWVKGHILSQRLHGPGDERNLVPIPGSTNAQMESAAESVAKEAIKVPGTRLWYRAKVKYHSGNAPVKYFPAKITIEWGKAKKGQKPQVGKNKDPQSPKGFSVPSPDTPKGGKLPAVNLDQAGIVALLRALEGRMQLALAIRRERRRGGNFETVPKFEKRMEAYFKKRKPNVSFSAVYLPVIHRLLDAGTITIRK